MNSETESIDQQNLHSAFVRTNVLLALCTVLSMALVFTIFQMGSLEKRVVTIETQIAAAKESLQKYVEKEPSK